MIRTSKVREAEWDLVRGNHQGQRQLPRDQEAGHKTVPDQGMPKCQKALASQEPSTQDETKSACLGSNGLESRRKNFGAMDIIGPIQPLV
jgi:hypothetical protein